MHSVKVYNKKDALKRTTYHPQPASPLRAGAYFALGRYGRYSVGFEGLRAAFAERR